MLRIYISNNRRCNNMNLSQAKRKLRQAEREAKRAEREAKRA